MLWMDLCHQDRFPVQRHRGQACSCLWEETRAFHIGPKSWYNLITSTFFKNVTFIYHLNYKTVHIINVSELVHLCSCFTTFLLRHKTSRRNENNWHSPAVPCLGIQICSAFFLLFNIFYMKFKVICLDFISNTNRKQCNIMKEKTKL